MGGWPQSHESGVSPFPDPEEWGEFSSGQGEGQSDGQSPPRGPGTVDYG